MNEGIARSAADIDTVWINGYGFPSARGGPMRYVKILGLNAVPAAIRRFTDEAIPSSGNRRPCSKRAPLPARFSDNHRTVGFTP